jgi:hypothetical protein
MSTALQDFERGLVGASRELHTKAQAARSGASVVPAPGPAGRSRLVRRVRQLNVAVQFGLALSTVSALGATAAYVLLSGQRTQTIASLECQITRRDSAIVDTVTGDPVVDCGAAWPSATGGRSSAPPLTAWALDNGTESAVVQPAAWARPAPSNGTRWKRLPTGWTVNLSVVALTDQLNDITSGLSGAATTPSGGQACTYAHSDVDTVRRLLGADDFDWVRLPLRDVMPGEG